MQSTGNPQSNQALSDHILAELERCIKNDDLPKVKALYKKISKTPQMDDFLVKALNIAAELTNQPIFNYIMRLIIAKIEKSYGKRADTVIRDMCLKNFTNST